MGFQNSQTLTLFQQCQLWSERICTQTLGWDTDPGLTLVFTCPSGCTLWIFAAFPSRAREGIPASPDVSSTKSRRGSSRGGNPALPGLPSWAGPQPQIHTRGRGGGSCATGLHQSSCACTSSCFLPQTEILWIPWASFPNRHQEQNLPPQLRTPQAQLGEALGPRKAGAVCPPRRAPERMCGAGDGGESSEQLSPA